MTGFKDIYFGEVSGEMEGSDHPELLLDGYLDVHKITEIALENQKFLFLGYKGSGKSSLAERVRLISENSYDQFAGIINLEDFPYARLNRVIKGNDEPEVKLPIAWSLLIGIKLLDLIYSDESINNKEEILLLLNILDQSGISGAVDVKEIVRRATKKSFKLQIPKVVEGSWSKEKIELLDDVPSFIELMKAEILKARPINKYYLFIDGLDEILTQRQDQYRALGSLVFEVSRLNKYFKDNNLKIKINVLCRTDLFERIRGANKNKIRQAQSFTFDWFVDPKDKAGSRLVEIANLRATNSLGRSVDLFTDFLPSRLGKWGKKSAEEFLLDTTRHTPRDFLLLLKNIQDVSKDGQPSIDDVYDGIRQYSHSYFLPEIFDELEGYVDADATHQLFQVFEKIGKRELQTKEIIEVIKNNKILNKENVSKILESLFECSAIGNVEYENGHSYFKFKYRNPYAVLDEDKALFLHRGLWRSLNLSGRELE